MSGLTKWLSYLAPGGCSGVLERADGIRVGAVGREKQDLVVDARGEDDVRLEPQHTSSLLYYHLPSCLSYFMIMIMINYFMTFNSGRILDVTELCTDRLRLKSGSYWKIIGKLN